MEEYVISNGKLENCLLKCNACDDYYEYVLINENLEEMGHVYFFFDEQQDCVFLSNIKRDEKFKGLGVGSILLYTMEHIAVQKGYSRVVGKFLPQSNGARGFYVHNGYTILNNGDGDSTRCGELRKYLNPSDVEAKYAEYVLKHVVEVIKRDNKQQ